MIVESEIYILLHIKIVEIKIQLFLIVLHNYFYCLIWYQKNF